MRNVNIRKVVLLDYITHYYENEYGPYLNMCDLGDSEIQKLAEREKGALVSYNRFDLGENFVCWRKEADDLLVRSYTEKFGNPLEGRAYFSLLGTFDKTYGLYRNPRKIVHIR
ncbi:MAG: hypothetical protein AAGA18_01245 [Verrucomicrobiota bacterium]